MRYWLFVLLLHGLVFGLGLGTMGMAFMALSLFGAPLVNLLAWSGLMSLAGLATAAANPVWHQRLGRCLQVLALAWFPLSLLVFGNARFSGTTEALWSAWLIGTGGLIVLILLSLIVSLIGALVRR